MLHKHGENKGERTRKEQLPRGVSEGIQSRVKQNIATCPVGDLPTEADSPITRRCGNL